MAEDASGGQVVKKPVVKPAPKPVAKPGAKPVASPPAKPGAKPVARPGAPKPAAPKPGARPAAKPGAKPPPKPAPRAAPEPREPAEVVAPKVRNARIAGAAVLFAVAGVEFATGVLAAGVVLNALWIILGVAAVLIGGNLFRGRFSAWGIAMILDAFALFLALVAWGWFMSWILIAALLASYVVLYIVRVPFGVGAWQIESAKENEETRRVIAARTRARAGVACPKCGNPQLWIAEDGSAFCLACRSGTIELAGGSPRSS